MVGLIIGADEDEAVELVMKMVKVDEEKNVANMGEATAADVVEIIVEEVVIMNDNVSFVIPSLSDNSKQWQWSLLCCDNGAPCQSVCLCPALLDTETDQDKEVSFSLVMDSAPAGPVWGQVRSQQNKIQEIFSPQPRLLPQAKPRVLLSFYYHFVLT